MTIMQRVLSVLKKGGVYTVEQLSDELNLSSQQIVSAIHAIRKNGVEIRCDLIYSLPDLNANLKVSQLDGLETYLRENGSISLEESSAKLGIQHLSVQIGKLIKRGLDIEKKQEYGKDALGRERFLTKYCLVGWGKPEDVELIANETDNSEKDSAKKTENTEGAQSCGECGYKSASEMQYDMEQIWRGKYQATKTKADAWDKLRVLIESGQQLISAMENYRSKELDWVLKTMDSCEQKGDEEEKENGN